VALRIKLSGDPGGQFKKNMTKLGGQMQQGIGRTARKTGSELKKAIYNNIKSGGNFGKPWKNAVRIETVPKRGGALSATVTTRYSSSPLGGAAQAFEEGATIHGNPLLWLPLHSVQRMSVRRFAQREGGLFSVNRPGKHPLLFGRKSGKPAFVGLESVRLRKRFDLRGTVQTVAQRIPEFWADQMNKALRIS
jgi:hypothetical protein